MKPKQLPRLWCALQGLLPLEPGRPRPRPGAVRRKGSPGPDADEATRRRTAWERPERGRIGVAVGRSRADRERRGAF